LEYVKYDTWAKHKIYFKKKNGKLLKRQFSLKTRKRHLFFLSGLLQQHSFSSRLLPANSKEKLMLHSANLKEN
jgi:hypothetical protein